MEAKARLDGLGSRLQRLGSQSLLALRTVAGLASAFITPPAAPARGWGLLADLALSKELATAATAPWSSRSPIPLRGSNGGSVSLVADGGFRDPGYVRDEETEHTASDFASPTGGAASVYAIATGTVRYLRRFTSENPSAFSVIIEHKIGMTRFTTAADDKNAWLGRLLWLAAGNSRQNPPTPRSATRTS